MIIYNRFNLLIRFILLLWSMFGNAAAETKLPPCPEDWSANWSNCYGSHYFPESDSRYSGEFQDNQFSGKGIFIWSNGNTYSGEFKRDKIDGHGTISLADGSVYVGKFRDGQYSDGTLTSPDGSVYIGNFRDGKFNGQGTYTWPNGAKYVGQFRDGVLNGQGTYTSPSGAKYVGKFRDDKYNGKGTLTWPDGDRFDGNFTDNQMNGRGTFFYADGNIKTGQWRNDIFVGDEAEVVSSRSQPSGQSSTTVTTDSKVSSLKKFLSGQSIPHILAMLWCILIVFQVLNVSISGTQKFRHLNLSFFIPKLRWMYKPKIFRELIINFFLLLLIPTGIAYLIVVIPGHNQLLTILFSLSLSITAACFHEFGHSFIAYLGGDKSVEQEGYLTLNPFRYYNHVTSLILPVMCFIYSGVFLPGAAVYINENYIRNKMWISFMFFGGVCGNLFVLTILLFLIKNFIGPYGTEILALVEFNASIQILIILYNLLPIPGLDGYGIIRRYLPYFIQENMDYIIQIGPFILFYALSTIPQVSDIFYGFSREFNNAVGLDSTLIKNGYDLSRIGSI